MSEARVSTGLDVYLKLQRLAKVTNARSMVQCVWRDGDVIPMSSVASVYFPARTVAALLVERCHAEGIISTVPGGDWGFKLDGQLSAEAADLLERLDYAMAVASTRICGPGCRHQSHRPVVVQFGF